MYLSAADREGRGDVVLGPAGFPQAFARTAVLAYADSPYAELFPTAAAKVEAFFARFVNGLKPGNARPESIKPGGIYEPACLRPLDVFARGSAAGARLPRCGPRTPRTRRACGLALAPPNPASSCFSDA